MRSRFASRVAKAGLAAALLMAPALGASAANAATWSPTGDLTTARAGQQAVLLLDGRSLVVGGSQNNQSTALASAEIFDPDAGTWSSGGTLTKARNFHTATTLESGK